MIIQWQDAGLSYVTSNREAPAIAAAVFSMSEEFINFWTIIE